MLVALVHGAAAALRLGRLADKIAPGAMAGFTSAAALLIGFAQLSNLTGTSLDKAGTLGEHLANVPDAVGGRNAPTLVLAVAAIAGLAALRRTRLPGALLVVLTATALSAALGANVWATVGDIPRMLPSLQLPALDLELTLRLLPTAVMITLIGSLESFAVIDRYSQRNCESAPNRELAALGTANLAAGLVGGYPVTGGLSRTAVNASAGAQTRLAGAIAAVGVLVTTAFLTPQLAALPKAALGAIIVVAVAGMIDVQAGFTHLQTSTRLPFAVSLLSTGLLGVLIVVLFVIANQPLGASGAYVQTSGFLRRRAGVTTWRVWYFVGMFAGGFLATQVFRSGSGVRSGYDALREAFPLGVVVPLVFGGAILLGYGAGLAGGCTSGHGLCGTAQRSKASVAVTATFMATAIATTAVLQLVTPL